MSFESWYCKSIKEAQERNEGEEKETIKQLQKFVDAGMFKTQEAREVATEEWSLNPTIWEHVVFEKDNDKQESTIDRMEEDLLRAQDDGMNQGFDGVFYVLEGRDLIPYPYKILNGRRIYETIPSED